MPSIGASWSDPEFGEVVGPDGARCYRIATAATLAGLSDKTVRKWIRANDGLARRAKALGHRGPQPWFIDADTFESLGRIQGWWPPPRTRVALATGAVDAVGGAVRQRVRDLEKQVLSLEGELHQTRQDKAELLQTVETLTRMARRS